MSEHTLPQLRVTVFSDYNCPYCYLGWLRLERLRRDYDLRVNWCMLEIHAENPVDGRAPGELFSPEQWRQLRADLDALAAEDGVRLDGLNCTSNSHRALLLAEAAKALGAEGFYPLHRRLFEAWLCEGRNLADESVLRELVAELGLDPALPDCAWSDPRYEDQLRQYALAARELGVKATPTFFFDRTPLSGLQPVQTLFDAARAALPLQSS